MISWMAVRETPLLSFGLPEFLDGDRISPIGWGLDLNLPRARAYKIAFLFYFIFFKIHIFINYSNLLILKILKNQNYIILGSLIM